MRRSPGTPLLLAQLLLIGVSAPAGGQNRKLSCDQALQLMVAEVTGAPVDTSIYIFKDRRDADNALRRLTFLANGSPRCPAAHGARGLVKQRLVPTGWFPKDLPGQRVGIRWKEDALYDLALAAKKGGPAAVAAATAGSKILLPEKVGMPYLVKEVGPTLLAIPQAESEIPDTIRYFHRGRLAAWLWRPATADSAFSVYQAAGGSADRAALELARLRLATGRPGADSLYYQVAASADPRIVRDLRYDIGLVADPQELSAFDRLQSPARPAWLRRFWEDRDLEDLRPRGSRLREHYRRIGVARERFRLLSYPRHYELNELWINRDAEYDDRGLVYIRHGEPDVTASALRVGACPNTSWLYRRLEGNLVLHFVARQNPDDWRLVETLANVSGERGATTRVRRAGPSHSCAVVDDLADSRRRLDPIYARLAVNQTQRNWERELNITTRSREVSTTTDSDLLRFPSDLNLSWRAYGLLGNSPRRGRMLVLVSVPAPSLAPISQDPLAYGFRMRLVARSGPRAFELDSVRRLGVRQAPKKGQMVTFTTEVPLEAGTWRVGLALQQQRDSAGEVRHDREVPVPDARGTRLALSDIVLGDATGGWPWAAPDGPFPLSSTGTYVRGEPVPIFYEIAGAGTRGDIESEVTLVRDDGKGRSTIRFTERTDRPVLRVRRELNTSKSQPGRYTLTVRIRTPDNRRAARQTTLILIPKPD
ncbi:MAG TPA: GWxTD domain-containing protein [Gemmatimonadales bacterium]|nr:GWxTD domain-containing protein [Gemmatimonadales bacterium]